VNLVSTVYQRFRLLIHEGSKFLVVGGIGFAVTEVAFNLFRFSAGLGLFTSNALATIIATVVTFIGNRYWTFRHRQGKGTTHETVMFFVLNGIGLLIQYGAVWVAQNVFGFPHNDKFSTNVALLLGIALATLFRFWSYRKWVWHAQPESPEATGVAMAAGDPLSAGPESREPALVPPDLMFRPAPPGQNGQNGYGAQGYGAQGYGAQQDRRGDQPGRERPHGPRHARLR
jgi:putative flippase GtrA